MIYCPPQVSNFVPKKSRWGSVRRFDDLVGRFVGEMMGIGGKEDGEKEGQDDGEKGEEMRLPQIEWARALVCARGYPSVFFRIVRKLKKHLNVEQFQLPAGFHVENQALMYMGNEGAVVRGRGAREAARKQDDGRRNRSAGSREVRMGEMARVVPFPENGIEKSEDHARVVAARVVLGFV